MRYSVWNQAHKRYDYYEALGTAGEPTANVPAPKHLRSKTLGITPEEAAWPLPADARKIGAGPLPMGRIARRGGGSALGSAEESSSMVSIALLGIAAYVLWRYAR